MLWVTYCATALSKASSWLSTMTSATNQKAVFLDRDGVINSDRGYVSQWSEFELLPGVVTALADMQALGYRLIIVTNQSGIGRGFYTEGDFAALSTQLIDFLAGHDVQLTAIYHCPHHPTEAQGGFKKYCDCRKPQPGMVLRGVDDWQLEVEACALVGDKSSDIEAGRRAGIGHLFQVASEGEIEGDGVTSVADLPEVVKYLTALAEQ